MTAAEKRNTRGCCEATAGATTGSVKNSRNPIVADGCRSGPTPQTKCCKAAGPPSDRERSPTDRHTDTKRARRPGASEDCHAPRWSARPCPRGFGRAGGARARPRTDSRLSRPHNEGRAVRRRDRHAAQRRAIPSSTAPAPETHPTKNVDGFGRWAVLCLPTYQPASSDPRRRRGRSQHRDSTPRQIHTRAPAALDKTRGDLEHDSDRNPIPAGGNQ